MQDRKTAWYMPTSLRGIANRARKDPKQRFGNLYTLLNEENLKWCFRQLRKGAAPGVDAVTHQEYAKHLDGNIKDLVQRLKDKRYRAKLVRRKHIPKGGGKTRPLGIPVLEDKLLQMAVARTLEAIWEQDFLNTNWGYRPRRGAQMASRTLAGRLVIGKYNWIVEADIRGFFGHVDHNWMVKMLERRVDDKALIRLIGKWLKAGILEEDGKVQHPATGTPQGGIASPVLSNIYLHYVLDLWFEKRTRKASKGQAMLMRYADDFVCAFQYREDAEAFMQALRERLGKFGLELAEDKSGIVRFSRHDMERNGGFEFLGFRYHWTKSRKGTAHVQRMTAPKKLQASVARFAEWIKRYRNLRKRILMARLRQKLTGYWNYYGVTGNFRSLGKFWWRMLGLLYKWLNRRSQRRSYTWQGFIDLLRDFAIPGPRITESRHEQLQWSWAQCVSVPGERR